MNRLLAGRYRPRGRPESSRLREALAPGHSTLLEYERLSVAVSGNLPEDRQRAFTFVSGRIDNRPTLSAQLGLPENTPAETMLAAAWSHWLYDLLPRLRGDFVVMVWDPRASCGLLARDQLGTRPVFLHESAGETTFALELTHLLHALPRRPAPDTATVGHWIAGGSRPGDSTLFEGIRRLAPGTALMLGPNGSQETAYWEPSFVEPLREPVSVLAEMLRERLGSAVEPRSETGAHTAILMSGGLDSAAVAATAARVASHRPLALSGVFPDHPEADESELIAELKESLALPGLTAEVRSGGLLAYVAATIERWQVPPLAWGDFWSGRLLAEGARAGRVVALTGDGGDELFGTRSHLMADQLLEGHLRRSFASALALPGAAYGPSRREVAGTYASTAIAGAVPYRLARVIPRRLTGLPHWMHASTRRRVEASSDPHAWKRLDGPRWWAHAAYGLTRGIEEVGVFERQRRRSADAGIETRSPLLDLDLVEFALRLPPGSSFDRRWNRPLLRTALSQELPDSVRLRPGKAWFQSLIIDCLLDADGAATRALLGGPSSEIGAYVDVRTARETLLDDVARRRAEPFQTMLSLWRLLTAELWLRHESDPAKGLSLDGIYLSEPCVEISRDSGCSSLFQP